jgi:hypothetical protein
VHHRARARDRHGPQGVRRPGAPGGKRSSSPWTCRATATPRSRRARPRSSGWPTSSRRICAIWDVARSCCSGTRWGRRSSPRPPCDTPTPSTGSSWSPPPSTAITAARYVSCGAWRAICGARARRCCCWAPASMCGRDRTSGARCGRCSPTAPRPPTLGSRRPPSWCGANTTSSFP